MSKLLIEEQPMVFQPSLAEAIGLKEAVVLQQVQYWCNVNKRGGDTRRHRHKDEDGKARWWTYNSASEWAKNFPWWSESTVRKYLSRLRKKGLVITGHFSEDKYDRTLWYAVRKEAVADLLGIEENPEETPANGPAGIPADESAGIQSDSSAGIPADEYRGTETSTETYAESACARTREEEKSSREDPNEESPPVEEIEATADEATADVDPATGWRYEDMTEQQQLLAERGWPYGRGLTSPGDNPAVQLHAEFYPHGATNYQRQLIAQKVSKAADKLEQRGGQSRKVASETALECWRETLQFWKGNSHRGRNVMNQITKFEEDFRARHEHGRRRSSTDQNNIYADVSGPGNWRRAVPRAQA